MIQVLEYDSPLFYKNFLESRGMAMQKKFGQNFLINPNARTKLAEALELKTGMSVWEVGPGLGCLSHEILKRGANLTAFEIDRGFCTVLTEIFSEEYQNQNGYGKFKLVCGDVLKTWKNEFKGNGSVTPDRFFGNLPYNVGSVIIADMISENVRFDKAVVTVQKEVAQRITAKPDTENYSSFSVLCQWAYNVSNVIDLSSASFWPKPNVDSRAVKFEKKDIFPSCNSPEHFLKLLRAIFMSRRKTLKNNLTNFYSDSNKAVTVLQKAGINSETRAEKLGLEEILKLSDVSWEIIND